MKLSRSCQGTIQQKLKKKLNRSTIYRDAIEGLEIFPIDPPAIEIAIEIVIRNSLRSQQIGQVSRGVNEVSRLLKNSFSRREKHRYECNQAYNTTKDPINILSFQNHLSTKKKNLSTMIPKTHIHTKQV